MVQNQGIDVYLAPCSDIDKRYQQYDVPALSPNFTGDPNEVYIQAVDGERFMVVTDLLKDFDMKGAGHLYFTYEIDQSRNGTGRGSYSTSSQLQSSIPKGTNLKGRSVLNTYHKKVDGTWSKCGFTFASLVIGKSPATPKSRIPC